MEATAALALSSTSACLPKVVPSCFPYPSNTFSDSRASSAALIAAFKTKDLRSSSPTTPSCSSAFRACSMDPVGRPRLFVLQAPSSSTDFAICSMASRIGPTTSAICSLTCMASGTSLATRSSLQVFKCFAMVVLLPLPKRSSTAVTVGFFFSFFQLFSGASYLLRSDKVLSPTHSVHTPLQNPPYPASLATRAPGPARARPLNASCFASCLRKFDRSPGMWGRDPLKVFPYEPCYPIAPG